MSDLLALGLLVAVTPVAVLAWGFRRQRRRWAREDALRQQRWAVEDQIWRERLPDGLREAMERGRHARRAIQREARRRLGLPEEEQS
jgi:hypothetical protein